MAAAVDLVTELVPSARPIAGLTVEVHELPDRTPVVVCEIPAFGDGDPDDTVILYGHLDKQPEMTGWSDGLGPWTPVIAGRPPLRPGRRRRRLRRLRQPRRHRGGAGHRRLPPPLRRAHRGQRGERQPRPGRPRRRPRCPASARPASCCASTRAASTTTACGSRPRCGASSAAPSPSTSSTRASTRAPPAASCPTPSASPAGSSPASRTPAPATSCVEACHVDRPGRSPRRGRGHRRPAGRRPCRRTSSRSSPAPSPPTADPVDQLLRRTWSPQLAVVGADGLPADQPGRQRAAALDGAAPVGAAAADVRLRTPRPAALADDAHRRPALRRRRPLRPDRQRRRVERAVVRALAARRRSTRRRSVTFGAPAARVRRGRHRSRSWACSAPASPRPSSW